MTKVRVKISSDNIAETVISPVWKGEFTHKIEKDRIYYLHELADGMLLKGADFTLVNDLENDCEEIAVNVEWYCDGAWESYWVGVFTKFECKINTFNCTLTAKVKPDTTYQCIFEGWDDVENIYNAGSVISVREFYGTYQAGLFCCTACRPSPEPVPACSSTQACAEETLVYANNPNCTADLYYIVTCFHRITADNTASTPPPYNSGWQYLSGSTWWRCPDTESLVVGVLERGRRFDAALLHLVSQLGCGLTLRSHFFNINATHAAPPTNDAYDYAEAWYKDLTIHQKSDVKRPFGDPSFSYVWAIKLKQVLSDLQTMFNVFWKVDGTSLILEHISYFEALAGADYTTKKMPLEIEYDINTPKTERFVWSDEDASDFFKGHPIVYSCGSGSVERKVNVFSTDVVFIRTEENQDKVDDNNWVLLSCSKEGPLYFINDQNKPLSWTNLHDKLHRHWRPFGSGSLNDAPETFLTTQPVKKQPEFSVGICCDEPFDPSKYVTTSLGQGRVQEATHNLFHDSLTLQLNY